MRIPKQERAGRIQPHQTQHVGDAVYAVQWVADSLYGQRLSNGVVYGQPGVHGLIGVLED